MTKRSFDDAFWGDTFVQDLDKDAKLLFAYLWTNKRCNSAGLYEITPKTISFETGISQDDILRLFKMLDQKVKWIPEHNVVWVKNFLRHQPMSPLFMKSVKVCLGAFKGNGIVNEFIEYNRHKGVSIEIDNGSETVGKGDIGCTEQEQYIETEQEQDIKNNGVIGEKGKEEIDKKSYGEGGLVKLSDAEHQKLLDKFGETQLNIRINRLATYIGSKGKRYKSHYMTILNWSMRDENGTHQQNNVGDGNARGTDSNGEKYVTGKYAHIVQR